MPESFEARPHRGIFQRVLHWQPFPHEQPRTYGQAWLLGLAIGVLALGGISVARWVLGDAASPWESVLIGAVEIAVVYGSVQTYRLHRRRKKD